MSKINTDGFRATHAAAYVSGLQTACREVKSASALIARFALYLSACGKSTQEVCCLMVDAVADIPGASMGVYVSQFRRIAEQGAEFVAGIIAERDACQTWVGFESLIRAYDVPKVTKGGQGKKAAKPTPQKENSSATDTLPGFVLAFQTLRATAPKVTANGEALTLIDQALALLRQDAQRDAAAAKAKA